jgi:hypothetical protein
MTQFVSCVSYMKLHNPCQECNPEQPLYTCACVCCCARETINERVVIREGRCRGRVEGWRGDEREKRRERGGRHTILVLV